MARGVNKVILVGNLGADPEVRYTQGGNAIANVRMATADSWKDKSGEKQERTEWHRLVFFSRLAEIVEQYLKKGARIYVEGRIQTRKWQGQDGQDRYTTEIVVSDLVMLGDRGGQNQGGGHRGGGGGAPPVSSPPAGRPPAPETRTGTEDFDDDIPFVRALTTEPWA